MIIECCSQERSYSTFYGLVGERFSKLNRVWTDSLEEAFKTYYSTIHRYETNRLRNIARFFGHLFATDSVSWAVFSCVKINEDDTTSSSRIFVKIMMGEVMESMGLKTLAERFKDEEVKRFCEGMFPMDVPKNTRFAINYFTSIGLGILTEGMREYLKVRSYHLSILPSLTTLLLQNAPRLIMEQRRAMLEAESSSSSDSSDSDSDSDTSSEDSDAGSDSSEDAARDRQRRRVPSVSSRRGKTPPRQRDGDRDTRRGVSPPRRGRDSMSPRSRDSPPPRRRESPRVHRRDSTPPRARPSPPRRRESPAARRRDQPVRRGGSPSPRRRTPETRGRAGSRSPRRRESPRREKDRSSPPRARRVRSMSRSISRSPPPPPPRAVRRDGDVPMRDGRRRREDSRDRDRDRDRNGRYVDDRDRYSMSRRRDDRDDRRRVT